MRSVVETPRLMDRAIPEWKDVHALCAADGPCVTVYLNRFAPATGAVSQAERVRRGLPELREKLLGRGLPDEVANLLLEPFLEMMSDEGADKGQSVSLAMFASVQGLKRFLVPWNLEDSVHVEGRFVVRPLWESMRRNRRLFVLLLARNTVRVLDCTGTQVREAALPPSFPQSLASFGDFDQPDHLLRNRSSVGPSLGAMTSVPFGTGSGHDKDYRHLHDFHRAINSALIGVLPAPACPLVLAGTEADIASFARVNTYEPTVGDVVLGSTDDGTTDAMLASLARQASLDALGEEERRALQRHEKSGIARQTGELLQIVRGAVEGRVLDLFLTAGSKAEYGNLDELLGQPAEPGRFRNNMEELLNVAMVETVRHHGHVWVLSPEQMPDATAVTAVFRY